MASTFLPRRYRRDVCVCVSQPVFKAAHIIKFFKPILTVGAVTRESSN